MSEMGQDFLSSAGFCAHGNASESCETCKEVKRAGLQAIRMLEKKIPDLTPEQRKEAIYLFLEALKNAAQTRGGVFHENVNEAYGAFPGQTLYLRREDPAKVFGALEGKDIPLVFDRAVNPGGEGYANCVEWEHTKGTRGLENTFLEGMSHLGGVVTVVGFEQGDGLSIQNVPSHFKKLMGVDRGLVRCARGSIQPKDIRMIVTGVPAAFFPPEHLTPREQELIEKRQSKGDAGPAQRIFRGITFEQPEISVK